MNPPADTFDNTPLCVQENTPPTEPVEMEDRKDSVGL